MEADFENVTALIRLFIQLLCCSRRDVFKVTINGHNTVENTSVNVFIAENIVKIVLMAQLHDGLPDCLGIQISGKDMPRVARNTSGY